MTSVKVLTYRSTFFGGHEQEYATPKDQYAWFSNFSMSIVA